MHVSSRLHMFITPARVSMQGSLQKKFLLVAYHLKNLSSKFHEDPTFWSGVIPLFVTLYNLEQKLLGFLHPGL